MNFSLEKRFVNHVSHCSLEKDEWITWNLFWMTVGHTCTTDSVDRSCPETNCPSSDKTSRWTVVFCFLKMPPRLLIIFWNIKAACSFPVLWICSLLLFASSKWNSCFRALSGKSNKIDMEILLSVGWIYNNTTFLKFQNSRIFPETSYISGQMEYSFDSWIFV